MSGILKTMIFCHVCGINFRKFCISNVYMTTFWQKRSNHTTDHVQYCLLICIDFFQKYVFIRYRGLFAIDKSS